MHNCPVASGTDELEEARRLDALLDYELLDTAADARFDRLVALAAELWDVPMAALSLLDDERQWFKSRIGIDDSETPRAWAFCDRTIRDEAVLVVEDAQRDARFLASPLVSAAPRIRFYAGAPLIAPGGERLGALCLMDRRPRSFGPAQRARLARLAATAVDLMESQRTARLLERKERLLALAELSQMAQIRYGRVFEDSLSEVYLFDADGLRLVAASRGVRENLGYEAAELRELTPLELMPQVARAPFERLLEPLRSGRRERVGFEREQRRKDGTRYPAAVTLELDRQGERPLFVAVVEDLTEKRAYQREHELRERALQRSNEALDQFAAGIAHDLQTPIGQIVGFTALLERHLGDTASDRARQTLGYIAQAADNMRRLVGSLLDYARLGTLTIDPEPVELREVVEQCLAELSAELDPGGVELGALPQVPGSATLLHQVFRNLIGNAVKYRSAEPLRLFVGAERRGAMLRIAIEDNGIGIAPRHAERIFEVFRRLHGDGSPYPGLGMGLALSKTIVEAHGGRIWLDTAPRPAGRGGGGSRFLIELPLSAPGLEQPLPQGARHDPAA